MSGQDLTYSDSLSLFIQGESFFCSLNVSHHRHRKNKATLRNGVVCFIRVYTFVLARHEHELIGRKPPPCRNTSRLHCALFTPHSLVVVCSRPSWQATMLGSKQCTPVQPAHSVHACVRRT